MVLNVSVSSCEELFSPAAKREAFALQNRSSSFVYFFKWEASEKNRKDGLLKCPFLLQLLLLIIYVKPNFSSYI